MNLKGELEMYLTCADELHDAVKKLANLSSPTLEQYTELAKVALSKVAEDNGIDYNADDLNTAIKVVKEQVLWASCWKDGDIGDQYFDTVVKD